MFVTPVQVREDIQKQESGAALGVDLETLTKEYNQNKKSVVDMLIANCMKVDCEIPRVVKGNFE